MGYRSDVTAVFYCEPKDYPAMKLFIDENIETEWLKECFKEEDRANGKGKFILFQADDVKWYESYPDVQEFDKMVERFKELADGEGSELTWAYEFARIGEEINDIEEHASNDADYVLHVNRVIDIEI